jgi:hypothetical protein
MRLPLAVILGFFAVASYGCVEPVAARMNVNDDGQWGGRPEATREWFRDLTQPDDPTQSCCGKADAFEADNFDREGSHYVAIITDGKGVIPNGTRIFVPNKKMKWDQGNPTGHGIIFLGDDGEVYCYVPPGGV